MIDLLNPRDHDTVTLLSEKHLEYIKTPRNDPTSKVDWLALREVQDDLSFPVPVLFRFSPSVDGEIVLRDENGKEQILSAKKGSATVTNLLIGMEYSWHVRTESGCSEVRHFRTDSRPPRMLYVDGITNVRDFGGFSTEDGKIIRQERIYRTSEMDTHVEITEKGIATLERDLKIRTDLDIRGIQDEYRGPILDPDRVQWINVPLAAYEHIFTEEQMQRYGESYKLLTDPENYPMIVHCWGGIDRTGTWLYILGGMLGVSENDLGLDYEMSSFTRWGRRSRYSEQFLEFRKGLSSYGGTLKAACTGYMHACGLTDEELDTIRKLLLVDQNEKRV